MEIPILRAVPSTILIALSSLVVFKSGSFILAISSNCNFVIDPTFIKFGLAEPFLIFAALTNKTDAGGVFKINV